MSVEVETPDGLRQLVVITASVCALAKVGGHALAAVWRDRAPLELRSEPAPSKGLRRILDGASASGMNLVRGQGVDERGCLRGRRNATATEDVRGGRERAALLEIHVARLLGQGARVAKEVRHHVSAALVRDAVPGTEGRATARHIHHDRGEGSERAQARRALHKTVVLKVLLGHAFIGEHKGHDEGQEDAQEDKEGDEGVCEEPRAAARPGEGAALVHGEKHVGELDCHKAAEEVGRPVAEARAPAAGWDGAREEADIVGLSAGRGSRRVRRNWDGDGGLLVLEGRHCGRRRGGRTS
mmetsp:Transcript_1412/g.4082  ORF Transcript_1412/g.4082 Transcript_1412/m.4082 type:complete len:298 (-) Transcript_1412:41-934(-)